MDQTKRARHRRHCPHHPWDWCNNGAIMRLGKYFGNPYHLVYHVFQETQMINLKPARPKASQRYLVNQN